MRTAVGKAPKGTLSVMRPDELGAVAIKGALDRVPGLDPSSIDDVIIGCAMPEGEQGMNVARIASLRAGIPGRGLRRHDQSLLLVRPAGDRLRRRAHHARPGPRRRRRRHRVDEHGADGRQQDLAESGAGRRRIPDVYLSTGLVAENHARESTVSRAEQDEFALRSHQRAIAAIEKGHFKNEIVPLTVRVVQQNGGKPAVKELTFDTDEGPRRDTSLEALAKLKPAFHVSGSVTAGNSSQTSDGAPPRSSPPPSWPRSAA